MTVGSKRQFFWSVGVPVIIGDVSYSVVNLLSPISFSLEIKFPATSPVEFKSSR